jgi:CNT family concentrative nucleoside transporter
MPLAAGFTALCGFAREGAHFVFGNLSTVCIESWGCVFAFNVLPLIIYFAALASILSHYGIIQAIVSGLNRVIRPLLGTSGAETLSATSNLILGQTEAPLLIKNYLATMSESQLFVVMVSGMAHMSAGLLAVYYAMGIPMKHMIIAAAMGIPGAILIAKIIVPEQGSVDTSATTRQERKGNIFDAIFQGTSTGTSLAIIVGAMILVFLGLLPLLDAIIGGFGCLINWCLAFVDVQIPALSLGYLFSWVFAPIAWLLGFTGTDFTQAAQLLGTKISINEFVAFTKMTSMHFSERATILLTYAIGNFANLASIGMQVGGISALAPSCQSTLAKLGFRALLGASLVGLLSAFIIGLLI